jgi:hypothetical protein
MLTDENVEGEGEKMITWLTMKAIFDELPTQRHQSESNRTWSEVSMQVVASIALIGV